MAPPAPAVAATSVGGPGTVAGVTGLDGDDAAPVPTTFVAVTVKVYAVPFASPVTTIGLDGPVAVAPPGDAVTVYEMIAAPPSSGAVKPTVAWPVPATADTSVGGPGTVAGVTWPDGADGGPVPATFVAATVKVYAVPFVSPATTIGLAVPVAVTPPGEAVTVYEAIAAPPLETGAAKLTVA
jgi:hypothetical protein